MDRIALGTRERNVWSIGTRHTNLGSMDEDYHLALWGLFWALEDIVDSLRSQRLKHHGERHHPGHSFRRTSHHEAVRTSHSLAGLCARQ